MDLRKVAASFETTNFEVFNETTQLWETSTLDGKIMPVDRFLSNFHRPTRRRMFGCDPDVALPASNTIRVPSTGEIFVLGEQRQDAMLGYNYDKVVIVHKCDYIGTINRKAAVGPGTDPGHLVNSQVGQHYMNVELRAAQEIDEHREDYEGAYFVIMPPHADVEQWDQITIGTDNYHVQAVYLDSGFKFCRAVQRPDPRKDFTYHYRGATVDYTPATGTVTDGFVNYNVTGFMQGFKVEDLNYTTIKSGDVKMVIRQEHIGIVPLTEDELTLDGQRYKVKGVQQDFLEDQYILHCTL